MIDRKLLKAERIKRLKKTFLDRIKNKSVPERVRKAFDAQVIEELEDSVSMSKYSEEETIVGSFVEDIPIYQRVFIVTEGLGRPADGMMGGYPWEGTCVVYVPDIQLLIDAQCLVMDDANKGWMNGSSLGRDGVYYPGDDTDHVIGFRFDRSNKEVMVGVSGNMGSDYGSILVITLKYLKELPSKIKNVYNPPDSGGPGGDDGIIIIPGDDNPPPKG